MQTKREAKIEAKKKKAKCPHARRLKARKIRQQHAREKYQVNGHTAALMESMVVRMKQARLQQASSAPQPDAQGTSRGNVLREGACSKPQRNADSNSKLRRERCRKGEVKR